MIYIDPEDKLNLYFDFDPGDNDDDDEIIEPEYIHGNEEYDENE